jgi:hypothetical protein
MSERTPDAGRVPRRKTTGLALAIAAAIAAAGATVPPTGTPPGDPFRITLEVPPDAASARAGTPPFSDGTATASAPLAPPDLLAA